MAVDNAMRSERAFAGAVAELQSALASWRKERKRREPIPEDLWRAMARLAQDYRPSPVAQALRVSYSSLKRRVTVTPSLNDRPGKRR
jgi:hypothetical protein